MGGEAKANEGSFVEVKVVKREIEGTTMRKIRFEELKRLRGKLD